MHIDKGLGHLPVFISETGWLAPEGQMPRQRVRDWLMKPLVKAMVDTTTNPFLDGVAWSVTTSNLGDESASHLYSNDLQRLTEQGEEWGKQLL